MCFDDDAHPPIPVLADSHVTARAVHIPSDDEVAIMAYSAEPEHHSNAQVVILPDVRGLHSYYKELADRFAESGFRALAIDYFARTAPDENRSEGFEYMAHVEAMTPESFERDLLAAVRWLRQSGPSVATFTLGFCYGGSLSFWSGTRHLDLAGVIGFYGGLSQTRGARTPVVGWADQIESPVLALFGGADESIPPDQIEAFQSKLDAGGVPNEVVVYDGAPHSFFDRRAVDFADASVDAWLRVQSFLKTGETVRV